MLTHAITRTPSASYADGLTTADLGRASHAGMLAQHAAYVDALRDLGLEVSVLEPLEEHPDACFVEDTAVITHAIAVLARPGAPARRGEVAPMESVLAKLRPIRRIEAPGTLDGGDVLEAGGHYFIGLSERTNAAGARQLGEHLEYAGHTWSTLEVGAGLHLKSSVNPLGGERLILSEDLAGHEAFARYERIVVAREEAYACNALFINGTVLFPAGFARTRAQLEAHGLETVELELGEARKMDGGLTCLSLRL